MESVSVRELRNHGGEVLDCVARGVAVSVGPHVARSATERAARQAHLQQAESEFEPIDELDLRVVPHPDQR